MQNINKLQDYIGQELTYKKFTEILGLDYRRGNGRTTQLNDIQQYYKLEKHKTKYLIVEKYKHKIPKQDNRKSLYYDDLSILILYALHNNKRCDTWSIKQALYITKLTNDSYELGRQDIRLTAEALESDRGYVYDFYNVIYDKYKSIFETTLNRMQNMKLLQYNTCMMICRKEIEIVYNEAGTPLRDENNNIVYRSNEVFTEANETEREIILVAENTALAAVGCKTIQQVMGHRYYEYYKSIVNKIIRKRANIEYYYKAYSIVKYNKGIAREIKEIEKYNSSIRLNKLKVDNISKLKNGKLNRLQEDKEILIKYIVDNRNNGQLKNYIDAILEEKEKNKEQEKQEHKYDDDFLEMIKEENLRLGVD